MHYMVLGFWEKAICFNKNGKVKRLSWRSLPPSRHILFLLVVLRIVENGIWTICSLITLLFNTKLFQWKLQTARSVEKPGHRSVKRRCYWNFQMSQTKFYSPQLHWSGKKKWIKSNLSAEKYHILVIWANFFNSRKKKPCYFFLNLDTTEGLEAKRASEETKNV